MTIIYIPLFFSFRATTPGILAQLNAVNTKGTFVVDPASLLDGSTALYARQLMKAGHFIIPLVGASNGSSIDMALNASSYLFDSYYGGHPSVLMLSGGPWSLSDCQVVQALKYQFALRNLDLTNSTIQGKAMGQTTFQAIQGIFQSALQFQPTFANHSLIATINGYDMNQTSSLSLILAYAASLNFTSVSYKSCLGLTASFPAGKHETD